MRIITFIILGFLPLFLLFSCSKQLNRTLSFSVMDYGAIGDGLGDDTISFQKAINAVAKNGGGDVYIPSGTYILQPIYLKSNVNLVGESRDTVKIKLIDHAPDWSRIVTVEKVENVKIRNITIDGNYEMNKTGNEHMHNIFIFDSKNIVIDNNRLMNAVGDGVSVSGSRKTSKYITISNNLIEDCHRSNIVIEQVNHVKIYNNLSKSNTGRPVLHFEPWEEINFSDAKIYSNTFETNQEPDYYSIELRGGWGEGNYFNGIEFYNNTVNSPDAEFLVMVTKGAKIHDNIFNVANIYIWVQNEDLNFYNNKINSHDGFVIEGTWGMNSKRLTISDNTVTLNGGDAVRILLGSNDTTFKRNTFKNKSKTHKAAYMNARLTDISNTSFIDNTFTNFEYGIVTDNDQNKFVNGLKIKGNTFKNIKKHSIYAPRESSRSVIVGKNKYINAGAILIKDDGFVE
ncbi:right-handed parallel beta-helix repeat-containing protein [Neobacillus niacini]|uniref:right-handed parallel beta-helix repeat-containing protein n=1 Tax=Neobacillus niacini TaxID=86668 RepID=UPI0021CB2200|nr:right-handed parallel beta-helix repeat-containing protein [Neobacillus niacini]MCM3765957.1 right-handed parallel beta-helix repeat-containing protein [Neobacillus niacini]